MLVLVLAASLGAQAAPTEQSCNLKQFTSCVTMFQTALNLNMTFFEEDCDSLFVCHFLCLSRASLEWDIFLQDYLMHLGATDEC
mgnify:CR=1 FL=1